MPPKTRAPRRSPAQIAADELAMTKKKLDQVDARIARLESELEDAHVAKIELTAMRDYQAGHPLLTQPAPGETGDKGGQG